MFIESVMPSNLLILCCPLLLLPSIFPSIRVFLDESALRIQWPKYWSFSFNISPSNEHPGLISFRMDSLDLFAVQGTLKSLLQHHSSIASNLWCSAFFTVQLSHPYMTTGKTIALTKQTFVGKVMSLLFNMLSRLVITFLPMMGARPNLHRAGWGFGGRGRRHVNPWLIHVNVWQKPLQYCKVISLQLIKINEKKKRQKKKSESRWIEVSPSGSAPLTSWWCFCLPNRILNCNSVITLACHFKSLLW